GRRSQNNAESLVGEVGKQNLARSGRVQIGWMVRRFERLDRLPTDDLDDRYLLVAVENLEISGLAGEVRQLANRIEPSGVQVEPGEEILDQADQGVAQAIGTRDRILSDETTAAQGGEQMVGRARSLLEASGDLGEWKAVRLARQDAEDVHRF